MATKNTLSQLQTIIALIDRVDSQIKGLRQAMKQVDIEINAVLNEDDRNISEIVVENTTGDEYEFQILHPPIKPGSVTVLLNKDAVSPDNYSVDCLAGVVTTNASIPAGKQIRIEYISPGLKSQIDELLTNIPDLSPAYFANKLSLYKRVIVWIDANIE